MNFFNVFLMPISHKNRPIKFSKESFIFLKYHNIINQLNPTYKRNIQIEHDPTHPRHPQERTIWKKPKPKFNNMQTSEHTHISRAIWVWQVIGSRLRADSGGRPSPNNSFERPLRKLMCPGRIYLRVSNDLLTQKGEKNTHTYTRTGGIMYYYCGRVYETESPLSKAKRKSAQPGVKI